MLSGNRLYFGVGEFKEVYRQMRANPRVEICAAADGGFLRYYGEAVFETDYALAEKALAGARHCEKSTTNRPATGSASSILKRQPPSSATCLP